MVHRRIPLKVPRIIAKVSFFLTEAVVYCELGKSEGVTGEKEKC
jgi:hypothetical protein